MNVLTAGDAEGEASSSRSPSRYLAWGEWLCVTVAFVLIGLWYTNPLWRHWRIYLVDPGDPLEHVCISWWLSRRILSWRLSGIWDLPPIYYPGRLTLTYTDPQIGVTLLGLPVYAATHSIVAAYNFVVLISVPLCALGAYALARHLTESRGAALIAGIAWGFGAWHGAQASHQQLLSLEGLPWVLLCLHRYGESRESRFLVGLFLWWVIQEYLCEYWGMFLILLIGPFSLLLLVMKYRLRGRDLAKPLLVITLAILAWMPSQWLFLVQAHSGHQHSPGMVKQFSANLANYFPERGTWLLGQWGVPAGQSEVTLTLGSVTLALAGLMIILLFRHARVTVPPLSSRYIAISRMLARIAPPFLILSAVAWISMMMLNTNDLVYFSLPMTLVTVGSVSRLFLVSLILWLNAPLLAWLRPHRIFVRDPRHPFLPYAALAFVAIIWSCGYDVQYENVWICPGIHGLVAWLPGIRSFRVLARMGIFADLAVVVLAAGGAAFCLRALQRRGTSVLWRAVGVTGLCALILLQNASKVGNPFAHSGACLPAPRAVDAWLARQPSAPLVELPLGENETGRMWGQLRHQKRMMNGYATFIRPGYGADKYLLEKPQSLAAIDRLRRLGVRYVVVDASLGGARALSAPYRLKFHDAVAAAYELPP